MVCQLFSAFAKSATSWYPALKPELLLSTIFIICQASGLSITSLVRCFFGMINGAECFRRPFRRCPTRFRVPLAPARPFLLSRSSECSNTRIHACSYRMNAAEGIRGGCSLGFQ